MKKSQIEFYEGVDGGWRWRERSSNGQIVATCGEGNGFKSLRNAKRNFTMHAARMKLSKWSAKVLMLLVGLAALGVVNGCAVFRGMSGFDQNSYTSAMTLKTDSLALIERSRRAQGETTPTPELLALQAQLDAQVAYEAGKGKENALSAVQWRLLADPKGNLLGGYLTRWASGAILSDGYVTEKKHQIGDAFDEVLRLEGGKRK